MCLAGLLCGHTRVPVCVIVGLSECVIVSLGTDVWAGGWGGLSAPYSVGPHLPFGAGSWQPLKPGLVSSDPWWDRSPARSPEGL